MDSGDSTAAARLARTGTLDPYGPGLALRILGLPFLPRLWSAAPERGFLWVFGPLLLLVSIASGVMGLRAGREIWSMLQRGASYYEANADPLLFEDGRFQLAGPRILHFEDPATEYAILIDPDETVSAEDLKAPDYIAVRSRQIVLRRRHETRSMDVERFEFFLGNGARIDGDGIRRFSDRYTYPGMLVLSVLFMTPYQLVPCLFYAGAVGLLLFGASGLWQRHSYGECFRLALATSAITVVVDAALLVFGVSSPLPGFVCWPLLMLVLGLVALRRRAPL